MENNESQRTKRRNFLSKLGGMLLGTALLGRFTKYFASTQNSPAAAPLMGTESLMGSIALFAADFAPRNWALCNGQILSIQQNQALFSLLGTTYGGNGVNNFALPDLRSRVPIHAGQGPGLPYYVLGETGGEVSHTLILNEMPAHIHTQYGSQNTATSDNPNGLLPAVSTDGTLQYASGNAVALNSGAIGITGASQAHNNVQPVLAVNYCICTAGIFPSRN